MSQALSDHNLKCLFTPDYLEGFNLDNLIIKKRMRFAGFSLRYQTKLFTPFIKSRKSFIR